MEIELFLATGWSLLETSAGGATYITPNGDSSRLLDSLSDTIGISLKNKLMSSASRGPNSCYEIIKHFEFNSDKLRAGTLLKRPSGQYVYLVKGSPEVILNLAVSSSIPADVQSSLMALARRGLRVLALAYREIDVHDHTSVTARSQSDLEKDLTFLGLIFLRNNLKLETKDTIITLRKASIDCKMITGDHIFTGIAVAADCAIIEKSAKVVVVDADNSGCIFLLDADTGLAVNEELEVILNRIRISSELCSTNNPMLTHKDAILASDSIDTTSSISSRLTLAVSGAGLNAIQEHQPHLMFMIVRHAKVFARTKPHDKKKVVDILMQGSELKRKNIQVLFCGDGANDMMALRSATVGTLKNTVFICRNYL
jgi:magnesium-transporting ATPase (P-type)